MREEEYLYEEQMKPKSLFAHMLAFVNVHR